VSRYDAKNAKKYIAAIAALREKESVSPQHHERKEKSVATFAAMREKESISPRRDERKEKTLRSFRLCEKKKVSRNGAMTGKKNS